MELIKRDGKYYAHITFEELEEKVIHTGGPPQHNSHQYGLDVHNGAALVIARRSYGFRESVPKLLRDKLVLKKKLVPFNQSTEWSQWSTITRQITKLFKKRKEVNTPGLWSVRRKLLLGIA